MEIFTLICFNHDYFNEDGNVIPEIFNFTNRAKAIKYVVNYYQKEYHYSKDDLKDIEIELDENSYFCDNYGNDLVEWMILKTDLI